MYRFVRRFIRNLPYLPRTLEQDLQNPLQRDRLPDARNVELEFPVVSGSLEENRRSARRWLWIAFTVAFCIATVEVLLGQSVLQWLPNLAAATGFVFAWLSYLAVLRPPFRWFLAWIVTPHVVLALAVIDDPTLVWLTAVVVAILIADFFASHYVHLQTTAPMDRRRALGLRRLWKSRFGLFRNLRGAELYGLALLLPLAAAVLFVVSDRTDPAAYAIQNLYRFALVVAAVLAALLLVELLAAFLFARRPLNPSLMLRHLGTAFTQWLTYNRSQVDAPGAYQTPAGACKYRRRMALGLVLLMAAAIPQFVGPARDFALISEGRHPTYRNLEDVPKEWEEPAQEELATEPEEDSPDPVASPPTLELYQQRMLERMPEEERRRYLERLEQERQAALAQANAESDEQPAETPAASAWSEWLDESFSHALTTAYMGLALLVLPFLATALSFVSLYAFALATTGRLAARFGPTTSVSPEELLSSDRWEELVSRVQASDDNTERGSLLLGVNANDNTPILVPREVFTEHAHLLGDSGSGKTSIGIASILSQLIRSGECSVVVLDLKGDDLALFQGVRSDAEEAGLRFRWFTNQLERSTYAFNPLGQAPLQRMTLYQKVDMLTAAMGLQYGRDYGRAYYSDSNARLLHAALEQHSPIDSFVHLADILGSPNAIRGVDRELRQAAAHLGAIVSRLADAEALNVVSGNSQPDSVLDAAIEFTDVFRTPQAIHFHLSSMIGTTSSAEIARIALYSLITAASAVPPKERVQTFVVIDEFQRIVAGNIEMLLQLARSLNIGIILANQSLMDLKTAGIDLIPAISANTRFRQIFAASNLEEQERISRGSGESLTFQQSWHEYIGGFTTLVDGRNLSEHITPRLRMNDILLATDDPLQSIVQIRRGAGYAQYGGLPFVMRSSHHISYETYRKRKAAEWPEQTEETLVPHIDATPHVPRPHGGRFTDSEVLIDEPAPAASVGDYLDRMYERQLAGANDSGSQEPASEPDHSFAEEHDHD